MNLLSSASIFSFFTIISRILGYLRDILIAIFLGASVFADAFFVAFRLPNTFRRLFAEGTFNAAFIPSYTSAQLKSQKEGKKFADDVLSLLLIILLFIVTIVEIFTPYLVYLIAPGFIEDDFKLIGIHCQLDGYKLAFNLNKFLKISLENFDYKIVIDNVEYTFEMFKHDSETYNTKIYLFTNKSYGKTPSFEPNLFDTISSSVYLIDEKKNIKHHLYGFISIKTGNLSSEIFRTSFKGGI